MAPTNWKAPETNQRLIAAIIASLDMPGGKIDYNNIGSIFGQGVTYDSIENRFRVLKREAEALKQEAIAGGRIGPDGVRKRLFRKSAPAPIAVEVGGSKNTKPAPKRKLCDITEGNGSNSNSDTTKQPKKKRRTPAPTPAIPSKSALEKSSTTDNEVNRNSGSSTVPLEKTPTSVRSRKDFIADLTSGRKLAPSPSRFLLEDSVHDGEDEGSDSDSPCPAPPAATLKSALYARKKKSKSVSRTNGKGVYLL